MSQTDKAKGLMGGANWVRVYHAYFQAMVVEGLTSLAARTLGPDTGFNVVAEIVEKGAMRGFGILVEEAAKEGVKLEEVSLRELLEYEVKCHSYAVKRMNVPFQVWEEAREEEPDRKYILYTRSCVYQDLVRKNPVVCAVCIGLTTGILRRSGINAKWVSKPERARLFCNLPEDRRPEWIVYRDASARLPECRIVIERFECAGKQDNA
ncbi:hypothetical protein Pyrfu_1378 [Pyrolobus fumarii 1A]|uniref:Uncharacterized protein n=1 Tax=Pyrolobus fumarii (strain DSM 11204 / 1A) TaxID=694429 RepID=G0EGT8_PYRF1|nr:hypothetical protein [Pyrolobus fumarii]AEM39236.1 hypothetical protein Pyrfu_1378 [Pyrolobus fumarii 1A]